MKSWFPSENLYILLLSGGTGTRMGSGVPKQFLELEGESLLLHSLRSFLDWGKSKSIILVSHPDYMERTERVCSPYLRERDRIVEGGATRHGSTLAGMDCLQISDADIVLVHDAARPFVSAADLDRLSVAAESYGVSTLADRNYETVLEEETKGIRFLDRNKIWFMKTPQAIRGDLLKRLPRESQAEEPTDLCTWAQKSGIPVKLTESHPYNIKITRPEDLELAEALYPLFRKVK
ncbi:2-C-methyl-D-erythritol 4-phosphate cytidylyltransferase [Leptospira fluminis]|uniref:2-C-methyl-D-erythritol 4-phosphate cytidylyltransferase n=1 Tax=Leptospira fluminis TaxID=2484979 RepID=A0A4R9GN05_9LEPT|nr:IspD/TarI family cytidylyltransferase [Leptospira fluminis]TGK15592.1 2-C-methyl-D-erythritol 4-phosphate cytidylyltransferase [Leptospira fluminis]